VTYNLKWGSRTVPPPHQSSSPTRGLRSIWCSPPLLVQPWLRVAYCLVFCRHLNLAWVVTLNNRICQLKWSDDWYLMIGDSLGWVDCVHKFVWQCLWIYLVLQGILPVASTAGMNWLSSPTVTEWTEHWQPNDRSAWSTGADNIVDCLASPGVKLAQNWWTPTITWNRTFFFWKPRI
jgi:hypothetical protein